MKALFCDGTGSVKLKTDQPLPAPLPGEVLLRVTHCGICDTDMQLAAGYMGFTGVLGHEFVGVDEHGQRFTAEINNACGRCQWCHKGLGNHCPTRSVLGIFNHDGAVAEWVAVPKINLHAIPANISNRAAVFIEPLAAAFQVMQQLCVFKSDRVAVLGDGKLGTLCAWVMRTHTEHVTLVGKHPAKMALAGDGIEKMLLEKALEQEAKAFDLVIDATGNASGLGAACRLCRPRGTVVLKTTVAGDHQLSLAPVVIDELTIIGSRCGPFSEAIAALAGEQFPVERLIEATYKLDDAEKAFEHARRKGAAKVLIEV